MVGSAAARAWRRWVLLQISAPERLSALRFLDPLAVLFAAARPSRTGPCQAVNPECEIPRPRPDSRLPALLAKPQQIAKAGSFSHLPNDEGGREVASVTARGTVATARYGRRSGSPTPRR